MDEFADSMMKSVSGSTSWPPRTLFQSQGQEVEKFHSIQEENKEQRAERGISGLRFPTNTEEHIRDAEIMA